MSGVSRQTLVIQRIRDEFNAVRASLSAGRIKGDSAKNYRLISGVLRNSGSGWDWIDDAGHAPSGFGVVTQDSSKISIAHAVSGLKVSSLQVTPDETYAARGLRVGASVGLDSSNIFLYTENPFAIADRVYYNGTIWVSESGVFTGLSYASSVLTLTHESMGPAGPDSLALATSRASSYAAAAATTDTTTQVAFYTGAFTGTSGASSAASTAASSAASSGAASTGTAHTHTIAHTHTMAHTHTIPGLVGFGAATTALNAHVIRHGIRSCAPTNPTDVSNASGNLWVTGLIEVAP